MISAIVAGAVANKPFQGGAAWTRLSWALGLRRLGLDVLFVEQLPPLAPDQAAGRERAGSTGYFRAVMERFGLAGSSSLLTSEGAHAAGLSRQDVLDYSGEADLLVNISGHLRDHAILRRVRRRAYVDLDPGYTQLWHEQGSDPSGVSSHDVHFTVGENIGSPSCSIPTGGLRWRPIRQPALLELWPVSTAGDPNRFTTVTTWRGPYGPVEHAGRTLGSKVHEFRRFVEMPLRAEQSFELAASIHAADASSREAAERHGWRFADPRRVAGDPDAFREYVQLSGGEFSVAQQMYVATRSGWFSDRTVRYLCSGKPAIVQDTGFSRNYPVGKGLLACDSLEGAVAAARAVADDYSGHALAARALAEEYFESDRVLAAFLEDAAAGA